MRMAVAADQLQLMRGAKATIALPRPLIISVVYLTVCAYSNETLRDACHPICLFGNTQRLLDEVVPSLPGVILHRQPWAMACDS